MSMKVTKEQFIGMTYDELLAENEKLWALNKHMGLKDMAVIGGLEKENEQLKADNAKLRELVKEIHVCLEDECKRCHEWGDTCDLEHQMRELGVDA